MASTSSSTPAAEVEERGRKRKRADGAADEAAEARPSKWRTRREHEIYSSKLLEAIRLVRAGPSSSSSSAAGGATRGRAVREAADRALAVAARGRTHWSRAILASRRRRFQAVRRARLRAPATPPPSRHGAAAAGTSSSAASATGQGSTSTPPLTERARMLGWLVPGGRRLSFPTLLEETTDYIEALQMQVRAMAALAEALSAISSNSSDAGSSSSSE